MTRAWRVLIVVCVGLALVAALGSFAPRSRHERVSASIIPASACGTFGAPRSAVLVDQVAGSMATKTYSITCATGVQTLWTQP